MTDQQALVRTFADFARTISARYDIGDVLYRLSDQVVEVLRLDGAGVCLGDQDGNLRFVTATSDRIIHVEERQISAVQGPCQDAFASGDRVTCADLSVEQRWPSFTGEAISQGCRAVAGIPMLAGDRRVGALNLYAGEAREWPADDLEIAQVLADMATGYVINARIINQTERISVQLQHALDSRIVIEQAKGILAERHGIDPGTAFDRLRSHARSNNRRLHDVAREVVDGALRL